MNRIPNILSSLTLCLICLLTLPGCKPKPPIPDKTLAAEQIKQAIIDNGELPGGNRIEIHTFEIKQIEAGTEPNTARVKFQIDFTRYPTSGLPPEYQTDEPMRQTEDHQALLVLEKEHWTIRDVSLH